MVEKKEYRSAVRSRKMIRKAFMELLREKPFEKITVTDIVNRAEINRSTFYAHYPDVMGVIDEIQEEIIEYTQRALAEMDFSEFFDNPMPLLQNIIKLLEENSELYRLLSKSNIATKQLGHLKAILIDKTKSTIAMNEQYKQDQRIDFYIRFFMGGMVDVYSQWLNREIDRPLKDITENLAELIVHSSEFWKECINSERNSR